MTSRSSPSPEDLRQRYQQMSSKDLLAALNSEGEYTSAALGVIRNVLTDRGVDPEDWNPRASGKGYTASPTHSDYLADARVEIDRGCLWRAKEILSGNLPVRGYDLTLYEEYGALLAQMGDTLEAGRFLFLSGAQDPDYSYAVELYLQRFGKRGWRQLVGTFPAAAKLPSLADYPEAVRAALSGRPEVVDRHEMRHGPRRNMAQQGNGCGVALVLLFLLFLFASLVVGAITIIGMMGYFVFDVLL